MAKQMRTTVHIPDLLLARARQLASREGTTLAALVEEGLRNVIKTRSASQKKSFELRDASVDGQGLNPEFQGSWDGVRSAIYKAPA